jgi:hypothetical protein
MVDPFGNQQPGSWSVHSDTDPRWNKSGRADDIVVTDGGCRAMKNWIIKCKRKYGTPPKDCYQQCMKD